MKTAKMLQPNETVAAESLLKRDGNEERDQMCSNLLDDALYRMSDAELKAWQKKTQSHLENGKKRSAQYVHRLTNNGDYDSGGE